MVTKKPANAGFFSMMTIKMQNYTNNEYYGYY